MTTVVLSPPSTPRHHLGGRRSRVVAVLFVAGVIVGVLPAGGCQRARVTDGVTASLAVDDTNRGAPAAARELEFWHRLARAPIASNDDAFHAVLLFFEGKDDARGYPERVARLKAKGMLPRGFSAAADDAVSRGDLAVAMAAGLGIKGGLSMRLLGGQNPRYALRALEHRNLFPTSSPNQSFAGVELVGIMSRAEDYQRGDAPDLPASVMPGEVAAAASAPAPPGTGGVSVPVFLASQSAATERDRPSPAAATRPTVGAGGGAVSRELSVIVTGVEGNVQVRGAPDAPWEAAAEHMRFSGTAEFRTGVRSAVRFIIPPDQTYTLDQLSSTRVVEAVARGRDVKTDVVMDKGRLRYDLIRGSAPDPEPPPSLPSQDGTAPGATTAPFPTTSTSGLADDFSLEGPGVRYDSVIRSPSAQLGVRGTQVYLSDQPPFEPVAVSLTGRAVYRNTRRQLVAFGGQAKATIRGAQTSAAEQAIAVTSLDPSSPVALNDFDVSQEALVIQRGGFVRGDVLVGNSSVTDEKLQQGGLLGGALDFVLRWNGGKRRELVDLNLAVASPLDPVARDRVANPPFTISLTPGDPEAEAKRQASYPRTSRSGGRIGQNHIGPEGLEIASWPPDYPAGIYRVVVFNFLDKRPPPPPAPDGTEFVVTVFRNGNRFAESGVMKLGLLETSQPILVDVPPPSTARGVPVARRAARARR